MVISAGIARRVTHCRAMAMGVVNGIISIDFVAGGVRPYRQLLATQPLRVLRRDVAANVWPLRYFIPVMLLVVIGLLALLMGGNSLLWAILGGMVVLALLLGGSAGAACCCCVT